MRNTLIFAGSSCPGLTSQICHSLGMAPAAVELSQFANGETSVKIMTSIRDKDVFVVQSGSEKINDSIMELLIMISACKGGSANKITAVLPYFPYSRQSKKKSHRGAITARMLANLLHIAGVNHVITIDLHASQMQGFFRCPVDNLHAEPLIARWIRNNVDNWREAVCVSKNAGGTKRVTSLADALKLNFGMVTTDRRRHGNMSSSMLLDGCGDSNQGSDSGQDVDTSTEEQSRRKKPGSKSNESNGIPHMTLEGLPIPRKINLVHPSPLRTTVISSPPNTSHMPISQITSGPSQPSDDTDEEKEDEDEEDKGDEELEQEHDDNEEELEYTDERAREVVHGRLIQGHIVEDDYPSPSMSAMSGSVILEHPDDDPMAHSRNSSYFTGETHALGGTGDQDALSDEEEEVFTIPDVEQTITLVGNVKGRTVFIVDDMIDKAGSWIAAAETVVKRGGASKVYVIATHGLFGGDSLKQLQSCDCIDTILVTNSFPISEEKAKAAKKLIILDLSNLLGEAIRRNHHGESISALYQHIHD